MTADVERAPRRLSRRQESLGVVLVAVLVAVLLKAFVAQVFYIPSASMEPGLVKDDRILVEKPSYWFGGGPERGDVVVFEDPGGWLDGIEVGGSPGPVGRAFGALGLYPTGGHLVKRVVAVAGDTVVCCDAEGRISVNGTPLDEQGYVEPQQDCNGPMTGTCRWSAGPVPEGAVFVMGDNRDDSGDSTVHLCGPRRPACEDGPFVDTDLVVGKVVARLWPLDRFDLLGRPGSFAEVP